VQLAIECPVLCLQLDFSLRSPLAGTSLVSAGIHGPPAMLRASGSLPGYPIGGFVASCCLQRLARTAGT